MRVVLIAVLTCLLTIEGSAQLRSRVYASGFSSPVAFVQDPADRDVQFVVAAGRPHPRRPRRRRCRDRLPRPVRRDRRGRRAGAARPGVRAGLRRRAGASSSTSPTGPATPSSRASAGRTTRWSPTPASRFDLRWSGAAARRSSRSRSPITTAATSRSGPTATSTSASATAAPATIPTIARRTRRSCSARCCASTSTCRTRIRSGYRRSAGQSVRRRRPGRGAAGDLGVRPAQSVALHLRRSGARRHRRAGHRRRRPGRVRRDRLRAARPRRPQLRLAQSRRRARQRHVACRSPISRSTDPIFEYDHSVGAVDHRRLRLSRHGARAATTAAATSSPTSSRAGVWSIALTSTQRRRGARVRTDRAHGGARRRSRSSATSARSASTRDGELFIVNFAQGRILRVVGAAAARHAVGAAHHPPVNPSPLLPERITPERRPRVAR